MDMNRRQLVGGALTLAGGPEGNSAIAREVVASRILKRAPLVLLIDRAGNPKETKRIYQQAFADFAWGEPPEIRHLIDYVDDNCWLDQRFGQLWRAISSWSPDQVLGAPRFYQHDLEWWQIPPEAMADEVRRRMVTDIGSRSLAVVAQGDEPIDLILAFAGGASHDHGVSHHWTGSFYCTFFVPNRKDSIHPRPRTLPTLSPTQSARRVASQLHNDARKMEENGCEERFAEYFARSYWA